MKQGIKSQAIDDNGGMDIDNNIEQNEAENAMREAELCLSKGSLQVDQRRIQKTEVGAGPCVLPWSGMMPSMRAAKA